MPPVDDGGPLSSREIELIKKWIDDGARFGSGSAEGLGKIDQDLDIKHTLTLESLYAPDMSDTLVQLEII